MSPLLSIIIPAYNASDFISDAIESVLDQEFKDFELLIINDGSTDSTLEIINEFALKDNRIKAFSIKNSGPSAARNFGINESKGKYLMFLDSDDTFSKNALDKVCSNLKDNPDMLIFGFYINNISKNQIYEHNAKSVFFNVKNDLDKNFGDLYEKNQLNPVWNKAILTSVVKNNMITFEDYRYGEDRIFVFDCLCFCNNVKVVDDLLYNYNMLNSESLVTKFSEEKFEICNIIDDRIVALQNTFGSFSSETNAKVSYMYLKSIISCLTNIFHTSCNYSFKEKKNAVRLIISDDKVKVALNQYKKHDFAMDVITIVLKSQNVFLNMFMAKTISFFNSNLSNIALHLKHPLSTLSKNKS